MPETLDDVTLLDRVQSLRLPSSADDPRGSTGGGRWLPWVLTLLLAGSTASLAARVYTAPPRAAVVGESTSAPASPGEKPASAPQPGNAAAKPAVAAGTVVLESKGYVIPSHQIQVSPVEISGRIVELFIEEGKHFNQGEKLAIIEMTNYKAELDEAAAALKSAEARAAELTDEEQQRDIQKAMADFRESESKLRQAKLDYARNMSLTSAVATQRDKEMAESDYRSSEQRTLSLKTTTEMLLTRLKMRQQGALSDVAAAKARYAKAEWRLSNCVIVAPVNGTILKKNAEIGNLVNALAFSGSLSLCDMADLSQLEVELDITERDVSKVIKGMPCTVRVDAYPDRPHRGVVDRLMPIANRAKGSVPVRVKVTVPPGEEGMYLKPEMGAVVAFIQPDK